MNIYIEWVLLKTLVFTDTTKTIKLKIKLHTSNSQKRNAYEYQQDKQIYKHEQGLQTSIRHTGLFQFAGCTDLRTSIGGAGLLEPSGGTDLIKITGRAILEFKYLLKLTVPTNLLEFKGRTGLRTSSGLPGLPEFFIF